MPTSQHIPRCQVYLHPAAATNRSAVEAIQRRTGLLIIISSGNRAPRLSAISRTPTDLGPWGGDAA